MAKATKRERVLQTSGDVVAALMAGPWREPAHAWLFEVGNATGFRCVRHCDALVTSLWPSRGIWVAGLEVKVDRGDWRRELDQPSKSAEHQRYLDYWWVAAPAGVVEVGEVPETWGLYEVDGKKCRVAKPAPRLTPEPYSAGFVAAVMRNATERQAVIRRAGFEEGRASATSEIGSDAVIELRSKTKELELKLRLAEGSLARHPMSDLAASVAEFERAAGLDPGTVAGGRWSTGVGAQFKAARLLAQYDARVLGSAFRRAADSLDDVAAVSETKVVGK